MLMKKETGEQRGGRFIVHNSTIRLVIDEDDADAREMLRLAGCNVVIVHAAPNRACEGVEYAALSELFEWLPPNMPSPLYKFGFRRSEGGLQIECVRADLEATAADLTYI